MFYKLCIIFVFYIQILLVKKNHKFVAILLVKKNHKFVATLLVKKNHKFVATIIYKLITYSSISISSSINFVFLFALFALVILLFCDEDISSTGKFTV